MLPKLQFLTESERRQAEYLIALADLRAAMHDAAATMTETGVADLAAIDQLRARVAALEPDWRESAIPAIDAARRYNIPPSTLTWLARDGRVRAEKRGRQWFIAVADLQAISGGIDHAAEEE